MSLLTLPAELELQIIFHLDPYSTLRLSKTNSKFFHLLRTRQGLTETLSLLEKHKRELFDTDNKDPFPSYGCFTAHPRDSFALNEISLLYGGSNMGAFDWN
jgi:hypothetical protein